MPKPDPTVVKNLCADYVALIESQSSQPDWPYPGDDYAASESAADARWEFWYEARGWATTEEISEAQRIVGKI